MVNLPNLKSKKQQENSSQVLKPSNGRESRAEARDFISQKHINGQFLPLY